MARTRWTLRGRLLLAPQLSEVQSLADVPTPRYGATVPLAGVRVKVSAKQFGADPTWDEWGETITAADGTFAIHAQKNQTRRRFRVRAMFKDDTLKIYPPNDSLLKKLVDIATHLIPGTPFQQLARAAKEAIVEQLLEQTSRITYDVKWQTVFEHGTGDKVDGPEVDFKNLIFAAGAPDDRGDFTACRHAEIWYVVKRAMAYLNALVDGAVGFRRDRSIAYLHPHDNSALPDSMQSSYSNPLNDICYLVRTSRHDQFTVSTILHELMHLWAYQHVRNENRLAPYFLTHFDTHTGRHKHSVAWHEGFAEVTSNELYRQLFGQQDEVYDRFVAETRPYSRPYLQAQGMKRASDLSEFEDGWHAVLNLLLCPDVCDLDMNVDGPFARDLSPGKKGSTGLCSAPRIRLVDLLRAVATPGGRRDGNFPIFAMRVPVFFDWLDVPEFTPEHKAAYAKILDPCETRQPRELLPSRITGMEKAPIDPDRLTGLGQPRL